MYTGTDDEWYIGDNHYRAQQFVCKGGRLCSTKEVGRLPTEVLWHRRENGQGWIPAKVIIVEMTEAAKWAIEYSRAKSTAVAANVSDGASGSADISERMCKPEIVKMTPRRAEQETVPRQAGHARNEFEMYISSMQMMLRDGNTSGDWSGLEGRMFARSRAAQG